MKKAVKRLLALCAALVLCITGGNIQYYAEGETKQGTVRILFTSDLNDHILSTGAVIASPGKDGNMSRKTEAAGGYACLKKVIDANRSGATVVVDAGNYSNGQFFDFRQMQNAPDLTLMGKLGYDAVTLGEREFFYDIGTMVNMIKKAKADPQILMANISGQDNDNGKMYADLCGEQGRIAPYTIVEKNGIKIGIFGIMDEKEGRRLRDLSDITVEDEVKSAKEAVDALKEGGAQLIICLDHGTDVNSSLAKAVSGIDVLVCSNRFTAVEEPVKVDDTWIVSAGMNGWNLGVLDIDISTKDVSGYKLAPIRKSIGYDKEVNEQVLNYLIDLNASYLKKAGYSYSKVICSNDVEFTDPRENYTEYGNNNMGDLLADAYVRALHYVTSDYSFAVGITDKASVGDALPKGDVTVTDILEATGANRGYDGLPGSSLLAVYMSGKDLRRLCEYDVSFARDRYPEEQMYFSGMKYVYSDKRSKLNKVEEVYVEEAQGYWIPVISSKYYRVVLNREIAERQELIAERSEGYLGIRFCHANKEPITQFSSAVLQIEGTEFKGWRGMCMELQEAVRNEKSVPVVDQAYNTARDTKTEDPAPDFFGYFKHPSDYAVHTYKMYGTGIIAAWAALKTVKFIWNRRKEKEN